VRIRSRAFHRIDRCNNKGFGCIKRVQRCNIASDVAVAPIDGRLNVAAGCGKGLARGGVGEAHGCEL